MSANEEDRRVVTNWLRQRRNQEPTAGVLKVLEVPESVLREMLDNTGVGYGSSGPYLLMASLMYDEGADSRGFPVILTRCERQALEMLREWRERYADANEIERVL